MKSNANIVTMCDSYKMVHHAMYPEGTEHVYSYFEARANATYPKTVFFGLQYLVKEYLEGEVLTKEMIDDAEKLTTVHFGTDTIFGRERWDRLLEKHGGKLPIRIKAVPEGMAIPIDNVLMTVENTDPEFYWLTNHLETMLTWVWHPSTVATLSRYTKEVIKEYMEETEADLAGLPFKLHDFGYRGVSGYEAACLGGAGHLVNFMGTDTVGAMELVLKYYNADLNTLAFSVPATEHSIMCALGPDGEAEQFKRVLEAYPTGIVSIVSDSYDIYNAAEKIIGEELKDLVLSRDGVTVIRPDSGDPVSTVLKLLDILGEKFGTTQTENEYELLHPKIRLIWGDGINPNGIEDILQAMKENYWSADNIVFGMGGSLLQKVNRDTQSFAFKASAVQRNGVWYDVYKDPIDRSKSSKRGKLALVKGTRDEKNFHTIESSIGDNPDDILETVFENGVLIRDMKFDEVRANAAL